MNDGKAIKPKLASFALALIVPVSLLGCAQIPPSIAFDRSSGQEVKKIALLHITGPVFVRVLNSGGPSALGGGIGGAFRDSVEGERSNEVFKLLMERKVVLDNALAESLQQSLTQAGFEVRYLQGVLPGYSTATKTYDYSLVQSYWQEADSILHVSLILAGFLSPAMSEDYHPIVGVRARLLDAKTKETRYFQSFCYGCSGSSKDIQYLVADPKFKYPSYGMLKRRFDDAAQGLRAGSAEIAVQIARQLGR